MTEGYKTCHNNIIHTENKKKLNISRLNLN